MDGRKNDFTERWIGIGCKEKTTDRSEIIFGNNFKIFFPLQSLSKINFLFSLARVESERFSSDYSSST